jgi:hypothetical protein
MAEVSQMPEAPTPTSEMGAPASPPSRKRSASPSPSKSNALAAPTDSSLEPPQKKTKLIRRKRRPARPQVDPSTVKSEPPPQTGTIFNIWYNKWSGGDREDAYLSKTAAPSRCSIKNDSGWTAADKITGSYFCLFFARGLCPKGHECQYLHRLPGTFDIFNPNVDCFGRDKHSDYRDDMGGVGSFLRQNRTLYIGRIHVTDDIEEVVARHFAEWGEVERTRCLTARGVAFVTYANEANSQFAKEAMAHQALDHGEVLNVRWATVDPNPLAAKRENARIEEQAAEAVRRALPADFVAELEGRETAEMRERRLRESGFGLVGYEAPDEVWFARSKELEGERREGLMLDAPPDEVVDTAGGEEEIPAANGNGDGNGIINSATLEALKGYSTNGPAPRAAPRATLGGPLVGYGSDDDSD